MEFCIDIRVDPLRVKGRGYLLRVHDNHFFKSLGILSRVYIGAQRGMFWDCSRVG